MNGSSQRAVNQIVERFLQLRSVGRRVSIDDVLDEFVGLGDRDRARSEVLQSLGRRRLSDNSGGGRTPQGAQALESDAEFPELDGYDIIDAVGRGGMGLVYEAYQQSTGRRVAVKFMRDAAGAAPSARRRFEREVELIARLQHPGIVSVLDSGVHMGRYYYVMEYVEGEPLDCALTNAKQDMRQALRVIIQVCQAVDYAHQRGVLHRDLKPSNIVIDARGAPHVLDFGLGKAFDPEGPGEYHASLSEPGQLLGTLGYMSPEQARGRIDQTSVRSDVYSLGAIAYELATGLLPCPVEGPLSEVLKGIEALDPRPPSVIRGRRDADLDAILLKALEKSPERRYATAADLASDIGRYLSHEAITARRTGRLTRMARWMRRHRTIAVGCAAVVLLCVTGGVAWYRIGVAREATVSAEHRRRLLAQQAADLVDKIFATARRGSPEDPPGDRARFAEMISQQAIEQMEAQFSNDYETKAAYCFTMGNRFREWDDFVQAEKFLQIALTLRRFLHGDERADSPTGFETQQDIADTHQQLGYALKLQGQGKFNEAHWNYLAAILIRERIGDGRGRALDLGYLGKLLSDWGKYADAEKAYNEAMAFWNHASNDENGREEITHVLNNKALLMLATQRYEEAEQAFRSNLDIYTQLYAGRDDPESKNHIAEAKTSLACALCKQGRTRPDKLEEAERLCGEALATRRQLYPEGSFKGEDHRALVGPSMQMGEILLLKGSAAEAEPLLRKCLRICENKNNFVTHPKTPVIKGMLGESLAMQSRYVEAEPLLRDSLNELRKLRGDGDIETVAALQRASLLYQNWGKLEKIAELTAPIPGPDAAGH